MGDQETQAKKGGGLDYANLNYERVYELGYNTIECQRCGEEIGRRDAYRIIRGKIGPYTIGLSNDPWICEDCMEEIEGGE